MQNSLIVAGLDIPNYPALVTPNLHFLDFPFFFKQFRITPQVFRTLSPESSNRAASKSRTFRALPKTFRKLHMSTCTQYHSYV